MKDTTNVIKDIRDVIFKDIMDKKFKAVLTFENDGVFSGSTEACDIAEKIGIELELHVNDGDKVESGQQIGFVLASPKNMAIAEEKIIGSISKYSGIATAARKAVDATGGKVRIVAGSWKKMPPPLKGGIRKAVVDGGADFRICHTPMIYLDKNYIKMLGSISNALQAVKELDGFIKVAQLKGKDKTIAEETKEAIENGSGLLMVDTGIIGDLETCLDTVDELGVRKDVEIAFAGNVKIKQISDIIKYDIDVLCIGKDIVDARLIDMKLDVVE